MPFYFQKQKIKMAFIEFGKIEILWVGLIIIILMFAYYFFKIRKLKHITKKISTNSILSKVMKKKSKKDKYISLLLLFTLFGFFFHNF